RRGGAGGGALWPPCPPACACGYGLLLYLRPKGPAPSAPNSAGKARATFSTRGLALLSLPGAWPRRGRGARQVAAQPHCDGKTKSPCSTQLHSGGRARMSGAHANVESAQRSGLDDLHPVLVRILDEGNLP